MEHSENISMNIIDTTNSKPMKKSQTEKEQKQKEKAQKRQQKKEAKEEQKRKMIEDKKQQKLNDADFMEKVNEETAEVIKRIIDEREKMLFKNTMLYNEFLDMEELTQNQLSKRILKYTSHRQSIKKNVLTENGKRFRPYPEIYIYRELKRLGIETKTISQKDYYFYKLKIGREKYDEIKHKDKEEEILSIYKKAEIDIIQYLKTVKAYIETATALYNARKDALAITQNEARKTHALEKIQCPICNSMVSRTGLSAHKKTKKCLECKTQNV
jgi:hypothetical protein